MSGKPSDLINLPMECPDCKGASGIPHIAMPRLFDATNVSMQCHQCGHEWHIDFSGRYVARESRGLGVKPPD